MSRDKSVEQIVRASYEAFSRRDRAAFEALLGEDFRFTSPMDNRIDRQSYFEICWPQNTELVVMTLQHVVAFGDKAFVTYEALKHDGKRFRNTELLTVTGGKISAVEVYFGWNIPHEVPAGSHRAEPAS
jgi:ketosteroid isomerase-like protein